MSGIDSYETDFVRWSEGQAQRLRALGASRTNIDLDWENVAEEIASLGRSQTAALANRLARIIEHLLKLQFSPADAPRRLRGESVRVQRLRVARLLGESPSLKARLTDMMADAAGLGTAYAVESLVRHGEDAAIDPVRSHGGHYSVDQVIDDWLPPAPDEI